EPLRGLLRHRRQPADVEGQLDRGAREVQVRSLEDAQLDQGPALPSPSRAVTEAPAQAPVAWKPPSTCTISPVVAGNKSDSSAQIALAVGSWSALSQPSGARGVQL